MVTHKLKKTMRAMTIIFFGLILTSCGTETPQGALENLLDLKETQAEETTPPPITPNDEATDATEAAEEEEPLTASATPSPSKTFGPEFFVNQLDQMIEADASAYTGNGSGPLAGTRFTTPDEEVHCHIAGQNAACAVPNKDIDWPEEQRAYGATLGSSGSARTVGWASMHDIPLDEAPMNWQQIDDFPYVETGGELYDGYKYIVSADWEGQLPDFICGVSGNTMICAHGDHGFAVSKSLYVTW